MPTAQPAALRALLAWLRYRRAPGSPLYVLRCK